MRFSHAPRAISVRLGDLNLVWVRCADGGASALVAPCGLAVPPISIGSITVQGGVKRRSERRGAGHVGMDESTGLHRRYGPVAPRCYMPGRGTRGSMKLCAAPPAEVVSPWCVRVEPVLQIDAEARPVEQ